jgi:hypothetical protein
MSSKIDGVPRDLLERAACNLTSGCDAYQIQQELTNILAAPVVERQVGEPHVVGYMPDHPDGEPLITQESHQDYVAELQATIDRMEREAKNDLIAYKAAIEKQAELRAEIDRLSKEALPDRHEAWMAGAEAGRSEIERLKGGQGEPVANAKPVAKLHAERLTGRDGEYGVTVEDPQWFNTCRLTGGIFNLYASQPAPVSVVLPEPHGKQSNLKDTQYAMGWNACIAEAEGMNK